jgi:uncharacterized protein (DUF362 family)
MESSWNDRNRKPPRRFRRSVSARDKPRGPSFGDRVAGRWCLDMKLTETPRVIIRHCEGYDAYRIREIVREGLEELSLKPFGRTLVKPNLVASGQQFPYAFTRAEVAEGVLRALRDVGGDDIQELAIGERSGITIPTRFAIRGAGYEEMLERVEGVKTYLFDEVPQVEVRYTHPGRLRDYVFTPEPVAKADFFVNVPKFKSHPWTTVTFSLKNYIGIQDDRHRLIDHDHRLNQKIADLQYIIQPQFIVIDAIVSGEGRMLTPVPREMKLLLMGNNQVAFDAVCCRILGLDPRSVEHIRLAEERGFGTTEASRITVTGDVSLEEAQRRAAGYNVGLVRVEKYFEGSHITAYAGPPPEPEHSNYCWGGCPGAIEEAIEILRQFDEECDAKMSRMHVVFGAYEGPIHPAPDEKVVFIGDCARWRGTLLGEEVTIDSTYRDRSTKDPYQAKHADIYAKLLSVTGQIRAARKLPYLRLHGCPVSVSEQILALAALGKVKNPIFDMEEGLRFNQAYLSWRVARACMRLSGKRYQVAGECPRGHAAPESV